MKQYCRYCSYMCCGDANWCEKLKICRSDSYIKRSNNCKSFEFNEIDAINGGIYKPKKEEKKESDKQLRLDCLLEEE